MLVDVSLTITAIANHEKDIVGDKATKNIIELPSMLGKIRIAPPFVGQCKKVFVPSMLGTQCCMKEKLAFYLLRTHQTVSEFDLLGSITLKTCSPFFVSPQVPSLDRRAPALALRYPLRVPGCTPILLA